MGSIKTQLDNIKNEFHNFAKKKALISCQTDLQPHCYECTLEWIDFSKKLEKKVDILLSKLNPTHELYLNLKLIKAFCELQVLNLFKHISKEKFLRSAEPVIRLCGASLSLYKEREEGIWLYILCQTLFVDLINMRNEKDDDDDEMSPIEKTNNETALSILENVGKIYKEFVVEKKMKPWGVDEIFSVYDSDGNLRKSGISNNFEKFYESNVERLLMQLSIAIENEPKIRKYGIDGLKYLLNQPPNHANMHLLIRAAMYVAQPFTNVHFFVQSQHIIAVSMFKLVEFRRSLPENQRSTVNPIQYDASYMYAEFGHRIFRKSFDLQIPDFMAKKGVTHLQKPPNFHHNDCVRLLPESPALRQFEKQFPTKLVTDDEKMKQVQKKIRQWLDRMTELKRNNTAPKDLCLEPLEWLEDRLGSIRGTCSCQIS